MPAGVAKSSSAEQTAPDCAISASRPGSACTDPTVALSPSPVRITPNASGPTKRMPCVAATTAISRDQRRAAVAPTGGAVRITAERRPALPPCASTSATLSQGVAITAQSIRVLIAASDRATLLPKMRFLFGLTA